MASLREYQSRFEARVRDERAEIRARSVPAAVMVVVVDALRSRAGARWWAVHAWRRRWTQRARAKRHAFSARPRVRVLRTRLALVFAGPSARRFAEAGASELLLGRVDRAFRRWSAALAADPKRLGLYDEYAYELWQRGRWDDAVDLYARREQVRRRLASEQMLDRLPFTVLDRQFAAAVGVSAFLDVYVKQQVLAGDTAQRSVLLTHTSSIANRPYLEYWQRHLRLQVLDPVAYHAMADAIRVAAVGLHALPHPDGRARTYVELGCEVQSRWEAEGRAPLLRLCDEHVERGRACLERFGMPRDAWFVTLHVRDDGYHPTRNADLFSYRKAIEAITGRGGWVVRMGDRVQPDPARPLTKLPPMPQVVDYTHSDARSDWMDVFLWGGCRFLLGTLSGPAHVVATFGIPAVYTNALPGWRTWYGADLALPKLYRSTREGRLLTFAEALSSPIGFTHVWDPLRDAGIDLIDNTPEQIEAAAVEMLERLESTVHYTPEDVELQRRYDSFEPPLRHRRPPVGARIGRDFLREYQHLLPG